MRYLLKKSATVQISDATAVTLYWEADFNEWGLGLSLFVTKNHLSLDVKFLCFEATLAVDVHP